MLKKRKTKTDRRKLLDKLEAVSKDIVRFRDGNFCQHCGKHVEGSDRHCSHVIPVSADYRLQFDPLNMKILCYGCHIQWWHLNPLEAEPWYKSTFPDRYSYLQERHLDNQGKGSLKIWELEELLAQLTLEYNEYELKKPWQ